MLLPLWAQNLGGGNAVKNAAASGTNTATGTASPVRFRDDSAAGTSSETGSATATRLGYASGTSAEVGEADDQRRRNAAASGTSTATGTASPVITHPSGNAGLLLVLGLNLGSAPAVKNAASSGTSTEVGKADDQRIRRVAAAGDGADTGQADDRRIRRSAAAADSKATGQADDRRIRNGAADATSTATGTLSPVRIRYDSAAGDSTEVGKADDRRLRSTSAAGDNAETGTADDRRVRQAIASGSTDTYGSDAPNRIDNEAVVGIVNVVGSATGAVITHPLFVGAGGGGFKRRELPLRPAQIPVYRVSSSARIAVSTSAAIVLVRYHSATARLLSSLEATPGIQIWIEHRRAAALVTVSVRASSRVAVGRHPLPEAGSGIAMAATWLRVRYRDSAEHVPTGSNASGFAVRYRSVDPPLMRMESTGSARRLDRRDVVMSDRNAAYRWRRSRRNRS